jgi:hypothetical protein
MKFVVCLLLDLLSLSCRKNSLVPNTIISVGGQCWCLRLFSPGRGAQKGVNRQYSFYYKKFLSVENRERKYLVEIYWI